MSDRHAERFETLAEEADERRRSLEAVGILLELAINNEVVRAGHIPLEDLVASRMNLPNPDRIAAHQEVKRLLTIGASAISTAQKAEGQRAVDARQMVPRPHSSGERQEQIH